MTQHYCFQCGNSIEWRLSDYREREICPICGWVHYVQLKVGAAVLIEHDNKLLLLQCAHEPWIGSWMIPAGYVELDEDPKDAAKREMFEETGLTLEVSELFKSYYFSDDPRGNGIVFVYKAIKISGELHINSELNAVQYFSWHEIPAYLTKGGHNEIIAEWRVKVQESQK